MKGNYTLTNFKSMLQKVPSPFQHRSGNGYITELNQNQSVCVNKMALNTIDGFLQQKKQQEEMVRINALEKSVSQRSKSEHQIP